MSTLAERTALPSSLTRETRGEQMFPRLADRDVPRITRFGTPQRYAKGEYLTRVGDPGVGIRVLLAGSVDVTQRLTHGGNALIVTLEAGGFLGELAQLSGRPSLVH